MTKPLNSLGFLTQGTRPADRASVTLAAVLADAATGVDIDDLEQVQLLLRHILTLGRNASVGVPVALAARQLEVSQPTVRAWIERGVLTTVSGQTPARVTADSLGETLAAVTELRNADRRGPLAGRVLEVLQDRRTRLEVADRIAELDSGDWEDIDMDNLDELFS